MSKRRYFARLRRHLRATGMGRRNRRSFMRSVRANHKIFKNWR